MHASLSNRCRTQIASNAWQVRIAPFDHRSSVTGEYQEYTVSVPSVNMRWDDLKPETVYNITVEACTNDGCGERLWGDYRCAG